MDTKSIGIVNDSILRGIGAQSPDKNVKTMENKQLDRGRDKDFSVNLSQRSQKIAESRQQALDIAKSTDPIRADLVAEFKARIASGSYQVDPGNIADGILKEAVRDELAKNPEI